MNKVEPEIRIYPDRINTGYKAYIFGKVYTGNCNLGSANTPFGYSWGRTTINPVRPKKVLWIAALHDLVYREYTSKWKFEPSIGNINRGDIHTFVESYLDHIQPKDIPKWNGKELRILRKIRSGPDQFKGTTLYDQSIEKGPKLSVNQEGTVISGYMFYDEPNVGRKVEIIPFDWFDGNGLWNSTEYEYLARERYGSTV